MMQYHDFLCKLFLEETTEIEQWPNTFQSRSQFIESSYIAASWHSFYSIIFNTPFSKV